MNPLKQEHIHIQITIANEDQAAVDYVGVQLKLLVLLKQMLDSPPPVTPTFDIFSDSFGK